MTEPAGLDHTVFEARRAPYLAVKVAEGLLAYLRRTLESHPRSRGDARG